MSILSWTTKRLSDLVENLGKIHKEEFRPFGSATIIPNTTQRTIDDASLENEPELSEATLLPDAQDDAGYVLNSSFVYKMDETSGTTLIDSRSGFDGRISGSPILSQSGLFAGDEEGIQLNASGDFFDFPGGFGGKSYERVVFSFAYGRNQAANPIFLYSDSGVFQVDQNSGLRFIDDGGTSTSVYDPADGGEFLYTFFLDITGGQHFFFLNGLPFFTDIRAPGSPLDGNQPFYIANDASTGTALGLWSFTSFTEDFGALDDCYQSWLQLSNQPHWYYDEIIQNGLATLGSIGDVDFHFPFFELSGTQVLDVSMNENHGTYLGTIGVNTVLGQASLDSAAMYSINVDGNIGGVSVAPSIDMALSDFTMIIQFQSSLAAGDEAVWSIQDSGATQYIAHVRVGVASEFRFYDGATIAGITGGGVYDDGAIHRVVCRHNAASQQLDLFEDGVYIGNVSTAALSMNSFAGQLLYLGERGSGSLDEFGGNISLPCLFSTALSSSACEALSVT